jgi:hypothetical protein
MKTTIRTASAALLMLCALETDASAGAPLVPRFDFVAPGWISPPLSIDMSPYWAAFGLADRGTNYYSAGAPLGPSPYWERFDPVSPLYQAWFGVYVVDDFPFAAEWRRRDPTVADIPDSIADVEALIVADQYVWLAAYGDASPVSEIEPSSVVVFGVPDGYFVMVATMRTSSDVGGTMPSFAWYPPYSTSASLVAPYAPTTYDIVARFKYIPSSRELVVVYASDAAWTLLDGTRMSTPADVRLEQLGMVFGVRFD